MITIRRAAPVEKDSLPLFAFLVGRAAQDARTPVDEQRAVQGFWQIMNRGFVYVAEREGKIVGSLALTETPTTWYGPAEMVCRFDDWFVVEPSLRGTVGRQLMARAAEDADGTPVIIRRLRRSVGRGVKADLLGYNVVGNIVQLR